jgi:hypothetical protein
MTRKIVIKVKRKRKGSKDGIQRSKRRRKEVKFKRI